MPIPEAYLCAAQQDAAAAGEYAALADVALEVEGLLLPAHSHVLALHSHLVRELLRAEADAGSPGWAAGWAPDAAEEGEEMGAAVSAGLPSWGSPQQQQHPWPPETPGAAAGNFPHSSSTSAGSHRHSRGHRHVQLFIEAPLRGCTLAAAVTALRCFYSALTQARA